MRLDLKDQYGIVPFPFSVCFKFNLCFVWIYFVCLIDLLFYDCLIRLGIWCLEYHVFLEISVIK